MQLASCASFRTSWLPSRQTAQRWLVISLLNLGDALMSPEGALHRPLPSYWTQPATYTDPQVFDTTRYSSDNLTSWIPHLTRIGQVTSSTSVLDLGCGTGGFTLALHTLTGARVVGMDISLRLLQYGARKPGGQELGWIQGQAESLPFAEATFARVLLSLVLHQLTNRAEALREIARVLQPGGLVIIRTITPEAVRRRVPFRFFPTVADLEAARMPTRSAIAALLGDAGFTMRQTEVVERHKALDFQTVLAEFQARPSASALTSEEFSQGLEAMREEWQRQGGRVVDPRPTLFMVGRKGES
jgi:ubiquinone/menaquinone biosynthesis C-methylase UbiE